MSRHSKCAAKGPPGGPSVRPDPSGVLPPPGARDLEGVLDEIQQGRGIVIVRSLPVEAHSVEDIATMFWAIGTHFGRGVSQSALGDVLGVVRDETPQG